jgi:hypothetical protein
MTVPGDAGHLRALAAEGRVLLAFTPDRPLADWTYWGLGLTTRTGACDTAAQRQATSR